MTTAWYSGYYSVSEDQQLHYLLIESENDPINDPLFVFFNGGQGLSSVEKAFEGLGPVTWGPDGFESARASWV